MRFDLVILGDTPDAWAAAEEAALLGRRAAVLRPDVDGRGTATGLGAALAAFGDDAYAEPAVPTASPRALWSDAVERHERTVTRLGRELGVRSWRGPVRMTGADSAEVFVDGVGREVTADLVLIAVGTTARRPRGLSVDGRTIFLPEDVPQMTAAPSALIVLGGNRTAAAFARLFAAAGSDVRVLDAPRRDGRGRRSGCSTGEVLDLRREGPGVGVRLTDGRELAADALLFAADRSGATASLGLAAAGLETDEDGRLWCDADGRTWVPTIAAAGEVVGFPRHLREGRGVVRRLLTTGAGDAFSRSRKASVRA